MKIPCDYQKFSNLDCCGQDAIALYVLHNTPEFVAFDPPQTTARCKDHRVRKWRQFVVDEDTYLVARVMLT